MSDLFSRVGGTRAGGEKATNDALGASTDAYEGFGAASGAYKEYAELHCLSAFSFQRGASTADELFARAARLGYRALAITDEATLAGIVRAWQAAREHGVALIVGAEFTTDSGIKLVLLVENRAGYAALCGLITRVRGRAPKGEYRLHEHDLAELEGAEGLFALWIPTVDDDAAVGARLAGYFPGRLWLAVELHYGFEAGLDDTTRLEKLTRLAAELAIPALAASDVHMHARGRRALQDCLTAIHHHVSVFEAGCALFANGERHLRTRDALAAIYPRELMAETVALAARCRFDLGELEYTYPHEVVPPGLTPAAHLRALTLEGCHWRWPEGVPTKAAGQIEHELTLIESLGYEHYFLTVQDIVDFARRQGILCQGRGSAANSAVCFALGITSIDPSKSELLFERFISKERDEPPDIDVDFEHERREEVIQYVFRRYGRHRAALTAVVSHYHAAGAIRDIGRALGFAPERIDQLARCAGRWTDEIPDATRLREQGFEPDEPQLKRLLVLAGTLIGFPRHLSQHPGGFVISDQPLDTLVPVENAAMAERTVIQWDKDDLDLVGLLKVDVLALGMLSVLRRSFQLLERHRGQDWGLAEIPSEDADTYAMIQRADTIGVFQIESRAQMAMLPRLKPATFYDLVIEVAIVRPGPIQGDMVHPYLKRRNGEEAITYPSEEVKAVFERTLGVPLFQEQVMALAIAAAGYTPGEADQLRRAMAAWKRHGGLEHHRQRITEGMRERGYTREFAERIFEQIKGFGSYGFPESHAASFALLTYASCWFKCHEQAIFACALINSWPMGFYTPDQVLQDARRHGVEVRAVDILESRWESTLEDAPESTGGLAIRLGLHMIKGLARSDAQRVLAARDMPGSVSVERLAARAGVKRLVLSKLADAGALERLSGDRHHARWAVAGVEASLPLFAELDAAEREDDEEDAEAAAVTLNPVEIGDAIRADYASVGTTLGPHPMALLRAAQGADDRHGLGSVVDSQRLATLPSDLGVAVAGLVIGRQRPGSAKGVVFVTLEDEFGMVNVVVWKDLAVRYRRVLLESRLLRVVGKLESHAGVRHVIAKRLIDQTALLDGLSPRSRDFH
ncbi:error-prone DNA polymerase [Salinicola rhizosphaerae]|uniref:Error-prone DNA polymerase n=1 Tax=Salinicola rhizosphaerae TaxID=1443141 RepID=A0ABQ3DUT9_9GAMM|nr:error-prone DNA polymerase [Salinicola rhizosphaerae]GHB13761.1 error-prone DNA polymerase [Salinicola rhizosphaerae]